jgi:hypothetical protein
MSVDSLYDPPSDHKETYKLFSKHILPELKNIHSIFNLGGMGDISSRIKEMMEHHNASFNVEFKEGKLSINCELYDEFEPVIMTYQIEIEKVNGSESKPLYNIYIEPHGSPNYDEEVYDGEYYIASSIYLQDLSIRGVLEVIKIALDNATKDWSVGEGPEAEGPIEVQLRSDPNKKVVFEAYFD